MFLDKEGEWLIFEETVATNPDTGKGEAYVTEETAPAVNSRELGRTGCEAATVQARSDL